MRKYSLLAIMDMLKNVVALKNEDSFYSDLQCLTSRIALKSSKRSFPQTQESTEIRHSFLFSPSVDVLTYFKGLSTRNIENGHTVSCQRTE